jgi:hypothetical protein
MFPTLLCLAALAPAAPPAQSPVPWWVPPAHRDAEFTRMLFAVLNQPIMAIGPGAGWFGPAESRYSWAWVADRHGVKPSAGVPEDKFKGASELFAALDRDRNGVLRADDFDWSDDAPFVRQLSEAGRWLGRADRNGDRKLSKDEWDALFKRAAAGKDHLTPDDVRALLYPPAPPRPSGAPPGMMPSKATLLTGLVTGEIGSSRPGPKVGEMAPDFTLKTPDGKQTISLAEFRRRKPVVLIFGSFT